MTHWVADRQISGAVTGGGSASLSHKGQEQGSRFSGISIVNENVFFRLYLVPCHGHPGLRMKTWALRQARGRAKDS